MSGLFDVPSGCTSANLVNRVGMRHITDSLVRNIIFLVTGSMLFGFSLNDFQRIQ